MGVRLRSKFFAAAFLVAAATATVAGVAHAQTAESIRAALKRQGQTCPNPHENFPGTLTFTMFQYNGVHILVTSGEVEAGDAQRLSNFLRSAGPVDEIWLDSPGGNAAEGPEIGRVIRRARLGTRVPAGFRCISSCTLAFLGGVVRHVDPGGAYGVHTFFVEDSFLTVLHILSAKTPFEERERKLREYMHASEQNSAQLAASWQLYSQEMGISRKFLLDEVLSQQSIVLTTPAEVLAMRQGDASSGVAPMSDEQIAKALQSYHCPDLGTLIRYNVVNSASR